MLPNQTDIELHMPLLEEYASKHTVIVELGCGNGNGSTRAFIRGLERSTCCRDECLLISVDIDPDRPEDMPDSAYWHKVTGPSESAWTVLAVEHILEDTQLSYPNLVFIDTVHTYEQMEKELAVWGAITRQDTVWLFHDTWMFGVYNHMTDAIKEYADAFDLLYEDITKDSHGLGRMYRG